MLKEQKQDRVGSRDRTGLELDIPGLELVLLYNVSANTFLEVGLSVCTPRPHRVAAKTPRAHTVVCFTSNVYSLQALLYKGYILQ